MVAGKRRFFSPWLMPLQRKSHDILCRILLWYFHAECLASRLKISTNASTAVHYISVNQILLTQPEKKVQGFHKRDQTLILFFRVFFGKAKGKTTCIYVTVTNVVFMFSTILISKMTFEFLFLFSLNLFRDNASSFCPIHSYVLYLQVMKNDHTADSTAYRGRHLASLSTLSHRGRDLSSLSTVSTNHLSLLFSVLLFFHIEVANSPAFLQ